MKSIPSGQRGLPRRYLMNNAFTRESDGDDDGTDDVPAPDNPHPGAKNYITPAGHARLKSELKHLVERERPEVVRTVSWAASNGDRSENGDYIYGKRRLREIDRRVRYLMKRLEKAEVVDPRDSSGDRVYFGATVVYEDGAGQERTISIVGTDEAEPARGLVSWVSPIAQALMKAQEGDTVVLRTPVGPEELTVLEVRYQAIG